MIAYVTVGADDIVLAKRFYASFLPALGYGLTEGPEGLIMLRNAADKFVDGFTREILGIYEI